LLLTAFAVVRTGAAEPAKATAGSDKVLHGLAGASCSLFAAAITCFALGGTETEPKTAAAAAAAVGFGSAVLVGAVKELLDIAGAGDPEVTDLLCTALGGLGASAGAWALLREQASSGTDPARLAPPFLIVGVVLALPVGEAWAKSRGKKGNPDARKSDSMGATFYSGHRPQR
jgi:hypothetical protein